MESIPLDELVLAFTSALTDINDRLKEQERAHQERVKAQYGQEFLVFAQSNTLTIKNARINVTVHPVVKEERANGSKVSKICLMFGGPDTAEPLNLEIALGTARK
jgi:hypothetical protein